jgi:hypothetical protein
MRTLIRKADARIRTADPFITSEVLYQLSYVGAGPIVAPQIKILSGSLGIPASLWEPDQGATP